MNGCLTVKSGIASLSIVIKNLLDLLNRFRFGNIQMVDERPVGTGGRSLIGYFQLRPYLCKGICMGRNINFRNDIYTNSTFSLNKFFKLLFRKRIIFRCRRFTGIVCQTGFQTECIICIKCLIFLIQFAVILQPDVVVGQMYLEIIHLVITHGS